MKWSRVWKPLCFLSLLALPVAALVFASQVEAAVAAVAASR
jgi:hypothetical protein